MKTIIKVLVTQSRPTLWDPMDYSQPDSADHGTLQARILQWVAIPFSKGSWRLNPDLQILSRFFTIWTIRKALGQIDSYSKYDLEAYVNFVNANKSRTLMM